MTTAEGELVHDAGDVAPVPWAEPDGFATLSEIREAAKALVDAGTWNFVEGGSGDEWTLAENVRAFQRWRFDPRMLTGIDPPDPSTVVLGLDVALPVFTAPFGFDGELHPLGHAAVAEGAADAGTLSIVPLICSRSLEDVAAAAPDAARIFQGLAWGPDDVFVNLGTRARRAGYDALVVTVDTSMPGWRERSMRDRWTPPAHAVLGNFADDPGALAAMMDFDQRMWTWERLGDACARVGLPWLPKGVLSAEDARAALDVGAAGVFVSNHGGRQLEGAPATLDVLPEVVDELGADGTVIIDGGIRRGSDVLKAVALGAHAVAVGRPVAWGLAAGGASGVTRVLDLLRRELVTTMSLCGRRTLADLDRSLVRPAAP
jgi:isopentenyl diphosphate isomerase/L-lactate dehydrogenase-like FMN-dependent dehydrogenase